MTVPVTCPRCGAALRAPGLMDSAWKCERHGAVSPLRVLPRAGTEHLRRVAGQAAVPVWSPLPLLPGWTLAGLATAGPEKALTAVGVALSGPSPLGGPADLVLVAEEPGTGYGARVAGLESPDPGDVAVGAPDAKVEASGHDTPLWRCDSAPDRCAFVGEAGGVWLWVVLWPPSAELVLLEHVDLHDLRQDHHAAEDLPQGAPSSRLDAAVPAR